MSSRREKRGFTLIEVVVAIGTVGDRVILSLGDSTDYLEKLVTANSGFGKGLVGTKPLLPLKKQLLLTRSLLPNAHTFKKSLTKL